MGKKETQIEFREAREGDRAEWLQLRRELWPDHDPASLDRDMDNILASDDEICFLAVDRGTGYVGFLEGTVHRCGENPYGHVEGWYVRPGHRRKGIGRKLVGEFELWCLHRSICSLTSDTNSKYQLSPAAHKGCGFRQIADLKIFLKEQDGRKEGDNPGEKA